ncbi:uncharacterized protein LOC131889767 [Tigriopus californicus]|uniref:uncharacterized protein LOC131889767 n=1 Tax=Tigriopus californicus TaxID=6832 RepID=UPI0027DA43D0|nr:uncharacterized protein LOC131889767 [Tigriopus californicus]
MHSVTLLSLALLVMSLCFWVTPSSGVTSGYCEREKAQCPADINKRAGDCAVFPAPYKIQKRQCMLFCRFRMAFYFTIDPWRCYCFHTCHNMHNVDAKYKFITGNTEFQFDPNNIGVEGYLVKKNMTCPLQGNRRVLRTLMNSKSQHWGDKAYNCKNMCHLFPPSTYYELTDTFCSCFATCTGIKPSDSYPSEVALMFKGRDPSLISVDRIY